MRYKDQGGSVPSSAVDFNNNEISLDNKKTYRERESEIRSLKLSRRNTRDDEHSDIHLNCGRSEYGIQL